MRWLAALKLASDILEEGTSIPDTGQFINGCVATRFGEQMGVVDGNRRRCSKQFECAAVGVSIRIWSRRTNENRTDDSPAATHDGNEHAAAACIMVTAQRFPVRNRVVRQIGARFAVRTPDAVDNPCRILLIHLERNQKAIARNQRYRGAIDLVVDLVQIEQGAETLTRFVQTGAHIRFTPCGFKKTRILNCNGSRRCQLIQHLKVTG